MTQPPTPPEPGNRGVNRYGALGALTPELQERIVRVVKAGNYLKTAAQYCGIGESTLRSWLGRGRKTAAARDAHPPDRLYCPQCDTDRTEQVQQVEVLNAHEDRRAADTRQEHRGYAVLDPCPTCRSEDTPRPWQVPDLDAPYLSFLEAVTMAETSAEVAAVTHWRAAFAEDWRAARDFLRYSKPTHWSPVTRVQITPEEAEKRIEAAAEQVLVAVGIDTDLVGEDYVVPGETDELDEGAVWDDDDDLG